MSKYSPLRRWLESRAGRLEVTVSFADLELVLGQSLPPSAYAHRAWWSNEMGGHIQAAAWIDAGFVVDSADLEARSVSFRSVGRPGRPGRPAEPAVVSRRGPVSESAAPSRPPDTAQLQAHDVLVAADRPWQSELRLRQARWREHLGRPAGDHRGAPLGSLLASGDETGNFLTPTVARAVEHARQQHGALISAPRMLQNMLSSQPLTFNLFGEMWADVDLATAVGRDLWPDLVHAVTEVRFEWSPGRGDRRFLGNRSAFDVALAAVDTTGRPTLVGIEVKYHEDLTQDPGPPRSDRYDQVARTSGVFRDPDDAALRALPLRQLWLDHLLALSMVGDDPDQVAAARFVVLAPASNPAVTAADVRYRRLLSDVLTYERRTLEEVVEVIAASTTAQWVRDFRARYLAPTS